MPIINMETAIVSAALLNSRSKWETAEANNGAPAVWLMNGLSVLGTTGLANPGADWHVI
jgi:hypothetical protein